MSNPLIKDVKNEVYESIFKLYETTIELKASQKKKKQEKEDLLELDSWMQNDLYECAHGRKPPHINSEELVNLMKWKLLRGKWRPRLVELASSNPNKTVEEITSKGLSYAFKNMIEEAVEELCKLKGVGPATASAILAVCAPTKCGFFADEVANTFLDGKIKYTLNEYLQINEQLQMISKKLNSKNQDCTWTPHKVELVLWTYAVNSQLNPEIIQEILNTV